MEGSNTLRNLHTPKPFWSNLSQYCFFLTFRFGTNGVLSSSVESLNPLKSFPTPTISLQRHISENSDPARRISCCPQCTESYEQELAKLVAKEYGKSSSEVKPEAGQPSLPQWLQNAKVLNYDTKTQVCSVWLQV